MFYEICSAGTLGGMAEVNSGFCLFYVNLCKPLRILQLKVFIYFQPKNLDKQLGLHLLAIQVVEFYFPMLEDSTMPKLAVG